MQKEYYECVLSLVLSSGFSDEERLELAWTIRNIM